MEHKWKVLTITSVGLFMASLDLFIVNIAFPDMAADFGGASLSSLSWVLNTYAIVFAALLVPAGRIADKIGRKRVFIYGLLLFSLASAFSAIAPSIDMLVAARVLQAVGGAMMLPTTLGLILPAFPASERPLAIGIWSAVGGVAAALGPPIGGLLVESSWRLIFVVNIPIGLLTAFVAMRVLERGPRAGRRKPRPARSGRAGVRDRPAHPRHRQGHRLGLGLGPRARVLRRLGRAGRRLRLPLGPPPRAGDRATAAAGPLLRPRQPRRHGLLRRLRGDAALGVLLLTEVWGYSALTAGLALSPDR